MVSRRRTNWPMLRLQWSAEGAAIRAGRPFSVWPKRGLTAKPLSKEGT